MTVGVPSENGTDLRLTAVVLLLLVALHAGCGQPQGTTQVGSDADELADEELEPIDTMPKPVKRSLPPPEPLQISPATTLLTEPLTPDGRVDYLAVLNQEASEGVPPQTNAAVPLFLATGLTHESYSDEMRSRFFGALQVPVPARDGPCLVLEHDFAIRIRGGSEEDGDRLEKELLEKANVLWSRVRNPVLAEWLEFNKEPLAAVVKSLDDPDYYCPLVSGTDDEFLLAHTQTPMLGVGRIVGRALLARAMLAMFERRPDDAFADVLTCYRLRRRALRGVCAVDMVSASAIHSHACRGSLYLLEHTELSDEQLVTLSTLLNEDIVPPALADKMLRFQRFEALNLAATCASDGVPFWKESVARFHQDTLWGSPVVACYEDIDWNTALQTINQQFDQLERAMELAEYPDRVEALTKVYDQINYAYGTTFGVATRFRWDNDVDRKQLSETIGGFLTAFICGPLVANELEVRWVTRQQLARLVVALERFRREDDCFPTDLEALVPRYLDSVPLDPYSGEPMIYVQKTDGYLLYSAGSQAIVAGDLVDDALLSNLVVRMRTQP